MLRLISSMTVKIRSVTISHLRFGKSPIRSTYYVNKADFVACHNTSYVDKYDMTKDLKEGASFLLNADWDVDTLSERLPAKMKRDIAVKKINFYTVDGNGIAKKIGLGSRINMILQSAFFKIANIIPLDDAVKYMKDAVVKSYGRKGEQVVNQNFAAIDMGIENVKKVDYPASWVTLPIQRPKRSLRREIRLLKSLLKISLFLQTKWRAMISLFQPLLNG